jgi:hypothetical protein
MDILIKTYNVLDKHPVTIKFLDPVNFHLPRVGEEVIVDGWKGLVRVVEHDYKNRLITVHA